MQITYFNVEFKKNCVNSTNFPMVVSKQIIHCEHFYRSIYLFFTKPIEWVDLAKMD